MVNVARGYLQGEGPFPERLPWLILAGQFLHEFEQAVGRWAGVGGGGSRGLAGRHPFRRAGLGRPREHRLRERCLPPSSSGETPGVDPIDGVHAVCRENVATDDRFPGG